jgi:hypothetical protein
MDIFANTTERDAAIAQCRTSASDLTAKELSFLESVEAAVQAAKQLTDKQVAWLKDIADRLAPKAFICIQKGMRGFFAVLMTVDDDGFPSPQNSGIGSYKTKEAAAPEARSWALTEGVPFIES